MKKRKVMIIEGSRDYANNLEQDLNSSGYDVIRITESFDAMRRVKKENPNLIIIDIVLPQLDGLAICKLLKSKIKFREIPVILVTREPDSSMEELGRRSRAEELLKKSIPFPELLSIIEKHLEGKDFPEESETYDDSGLTISVEKNDINRQKKVEFGKPIPGSRAKVLEESLKEISRDKKK